MPIDIFVLLKENQCDNALNLTYGQLLVQDNLPVGTFCQWLISAQKEDCYLTLEFQNFHVKKTLIQYLKKVCCYGIIWPTTKFDVL